MYDVIAFKRVQNIGRGAAHTLVINTFAESASDAIALSMTTVHIPFLPPNQAHESGEEILIRWKTVPEVAAPRHLNITIRIYCWDGRNRRHDIQYRLLTFEQDANTDASGHVIAPGVILAQRTTSTRSVWSLKLERRVKGLVSKPRALLTRASAAIRQRGRPSNG
jgi:hypothetical protein